MLTITHEGVRKVKTPSLFFKHFLDNFFFLFDFLKEELILILSFKLHLSFNMPFIQKGCIILRTF
jgi:hypothetical protein